jgi:HAD superfamily hydrolase (TIGR01662 family)
MPSHLEESIIEKCKEKILEIFLRVEEDGVNPFPGINELFRDLKERGMKIGVATGRMSLPEDEWKRFKRFGLDGFIDTIVTSKEVEKRKPEPDAIIECAKRLNVPVEECLVVGDTEADIIAAKKAGAIPVAVTTGQDSIDLLMKEKPKSIFGNLNDLIIFLEDQQVRGSGL